MRYNRIDNLRAISIISMVLYHAAWDLVFLYNFNWPWYKSLAGFVWQQSICWSFILISGFCHSMSRKPLKNAFKVFLCGLLVSLVTWIFTPNIRITFGILTFLGSAGIICSVLDKALAKVNSFLGLSLSIFLFGFCRNINIGSLGFFNFELFKLPSALYSNYFTSFLGMPHKAFYSTDYFSLFPWFFLYLSGFYLHKILKVNNRMSCLKGKQLKALSFLSKNSLLIYLLHQPLLSALFYLIF